MSAEEMPLQEPGNVRCNTTTVDSGADGLRWRSFTLKLPNGRQAIVDSRKIVHYCLSPDHDDGRHKARLFRARVGLNQENADLLVDALREAAASGDAAAGKVDPIVSIN